MPKTTTATLGKSLAFRPSGQVAPNRWMKAAMSERLCTWTDDPNDRLSCGKPTPELIRLYEAWARGHIGVIVTGNIMVDYHHLEAAGNAIIGLDDGLSGDRFEGFRQVASACKAHGSLAIAQINHAGRQVQSTIEKFPISASDVHLDLYGLYAQPRAASGAEVDSIVAAFSHAASYLESAGFDGVQLHSAHGYLLAQFLSSVTNLRDDDYGGKLENRAFIVLRIASEIRRRCSWRFILGIKVNIIDQGLTSSEVKQLCQIFDNARFDFVEFSGGNYERLAFQRRKDGPPTGLRREAYFLETFASMTVDWQHSRTYVTGGFHSYDAMNEALDIVDGLGLARPLCLEPDLIKQLLLGKTAGARAQKIPSSEFAVSAAIAGARMRQIACGQAPVDISTDDCFRVFQSKYRSWRSRRRHGYPKLT